MLTHEIISPNGDLPVFFNYYSTNNELITSHWHPHIEVIYIEKGTMEIISDQTSYVLEEKDLFIINSGFIHLTRIQEDTIMLLLQIPLDFFSQSLPATEQIYFQEYFPFQKFKKNEHYNLMISHLLTMLSLFKKKEKGYTFLFNSHLQLFLHQLYSFFSEKTDLTPLNSKNKHRIHLQKAIDYIQLHYTEAISLSEISNHLALNPEYFCRMFKKNMGFTFLEYVNQTRLTYIYEDLMNTTDSITRIRERHGFTNYKVFNRMFKASYGCTPSIARKTT